MYLNSRSLMFVHYTQSCAVRAPCAFVSLALAPIGATLADDAVATEENIRIAVVLGVDTWSDLGESTVSRWRL